MVNGIGGPSIPPLLQTLTTQQTQTTTQTQPTPDLTPFEEAAQAAGIDLSKLQGLRQKIQVAVEDAVKNAPDKSGQQLTDVVWGAVDKVLQDNGIDPNKIKSQLATAQDQVGETVRDTAPKAERPPAGPPPGPPPVQTASSAATTSPSTTASTTTDSSWATIAAELEALLQSLQAGQGGSNGSTNVDVEKLLQELRSGDAQTKERARAQLEQLINVLQQAKQQENNDDKATRLANTVTTALFGPAVDQYA